MIHVSNKEKKKRKQLVSAKKFSFSQKYFQINFLLLPLPLRQESSVNNIVELSEPTKTSNDQPQSQQRSKKISSASLSSLATSTASTSGAVRQVKGVTRSDSMQAALRAPIEPTMGIKKKPSFKKTPSQSHIQVKSSHASQIAFENEKGKLKKSRSFDRHSRDLESHRQRVSKKDKI